MPPSVVTSKSKWKQVAGVTANTGVFDRPRVLEPRANTSLVCHFFKFLQVKNHVSLSEIVSTLGPFRITSSDATCSHPFWNSETSLKNITWDSPKKKASLPAPQQSTKRHVSRQSLSAFCLDRDEQPTGVGGHGATRGTGHILASQIPGGD